MLLNKWGWQVQAEIPAKHLTNPGALNELGSLSFHIMGVMVKWGSLRNLSETKTDKWEKKVSQSPFLGCKMLTRMHLAPSA